MRLPGRGLRDVLDTEQRDLETLRRHRARHHIVVMASGVQPRALDHDIRRSQLAVRYTRGSLFADLSAGGGVSADAARIDRLIASHKDISNALSHEIKTPLPHMRFEIEMVRMTQTPQKITEHLDNIARNVDQLNAFVTATLDYAILERAELTLNVARHGFTHILPAIAASVKRNAPSSTTIECDVDPNAKAATCEIHLLETVVRNLPHNALRYPRSQVRLQFCLEGTGYVLRVDDDGPSIAPADRERVFESFVQLDSDGRVKSGFGLALAIVK